MIGRKAKIYPMNAATAVSQKKEHDIEGVIIGTGSYQKNNTTELSTTLIIETEEGLLAEVTTDRVQLAPMSSVEDKVKPAPAVKPKPTPAKTTGNKKTN